METPESHQEPEGSNGVAVEVRTGTKAKGEPMNPLAEWSEDLPAVPYEERSQLPDCAAVYFIFLDGGLVYVGMSECLRGRIYTHHHTARLAALPGRVSIRYRALDLNRPDLAEIEKQAIHLYSPCWNRPKVEQPATPLRLIQLRLDDDLIQEIEAWRIQFITSEQKVRNIEQGALGALHIRLKRKKIEKDQDGHSRQADT